MWTEAGRRVEHIFIRAWVCVGLSACKCLYLSKWKWGWLKFSTCDGLDVCQSLTPRCKLLSAPHFCLTLNTLLFWPFHTSVPLFIHTGLTNSTTLSVIDLIPNCRDGDHSSNKPKGNSESEPSTSKNRYNKRFFFSSAKAINHPRFSSLWNNILGWLSLFSKKQVRMTSYKNTICSACFEHNPTLLRINYDRELMVMICTAPTASLDW